MMILYILFLNVIFILYTAYALEYYGEFFITARPYAKRGICHRCVSVCVCVCVCVCHTLVLYQNG